MDPRLSAIRRGVPAVLEIALPVILIAGGLLSVFRLDGYSLVPVTALLDAWVIAFCILTIWSVSARVSGFVLLLLAYSVARTLLVVASQSPAVDAVQAHKWLLYLLAFALAVGRLWSREILLRRTVLLLVTLATLKSLLSFARAGFKERPGLFTENNFEIPLFCGLLAVLYDRMGRYRAWVVLGVGILVLLSGSRSGSLAYVGLVVYAVSRSRLRDSFFRYLMVLGLIGIAAVPLWVFQQRAATATQLDRLNFLEVFWAETAQWNPFNWLLGTVPITPLSPSSCSRLWYYVDLFASTGDGSCYAVILHAFVLRIIFDAGIVGLLLAFAGTWFLMRRAGVAFSLVLCLLYIALTNSLSVSGLNNSYVAIPIIVAITLALPRGEADGRGAARSLQRASMAPRGSVRRVDRGR